LSLQREAELLR
jgi:hypothetical protein